MAVTAHVSSLNRQKESDRLSTDGTLGTSQYVGRRVMEELRSARLRQLN